MSVRVRVLECPRCGAPLPRRALLVRLVCEYCRSDVVVDRWPVQAADYLGARDGYLSAGGDVPLLVCGMPWLIRGRIAVGHSTDVFLAERATRLGERAVVKLLRAPEDEPLLRREQAALQALEQSTEAGSQFFSTLLPQRIAFGRAERGRSGVALAALFREPAGFAHSLSDVTRAYAQAIDPRHVVWLWGRLLELLDWVHRSGWVHGAVLPTHVLVDAREHAVRLVGWSCAARAGAALTVADRDYEKLYPSELLAGSGLSPRVDLTMLARSLLLGVGGSHERASASVPADLARLLESEARGEGGSDAAELGVTLKATARRCFGRPAFVKLELP